jgi:Transposase, Mutator family
VAAWGFTVEGRRVLLHVMAGSKEDAETVTAFFEAMKRRGLNDPLLVISDGAPGIIKAIEICFPRAARRRYLAHRIRRQLAALRKELDQEYEPSPASIQSPQGWKPRQKIQQLSDLTSVSALLLPHHEPSALFGLIKRRDPACP